MTNNFIDIFKQMIRFPHNCNGKYVKNNLKQNNTEFEMNGPLSDNKEMTQFIVSCKKCSYHKSLKIPTVTALAIREYCMKNGYHSVKAFQKLDCHLCLDKRELQEQCFFHPRGILGACRGYFEEMEERENRMYEKMHKELGW